MHCTGRSNLLINCLFSSILLLFTFPCLADLVNYTGADLSPNIAEIIIHDHAITMNLEVDPKKINAFDPLPGIKLVADGVVLRGKILKKQLLPRVDRQSTLPPPGGVKPSKEVLFLKVLYPLDHLPSQLKIIPPHNQNGTITANIGFVVFHRNTQVIDFRYLPGEATLLLNWDDPWRSHFTLKSLDRYQKSIMSYLYIEPFEVRHEIVARVKDLKSWIPFNFNKKVLAPKDQKHLKEVIGKLFLSKNQIAIDGKTAPPVLEQINFVKFSSKGVTVEDSKQDIQTTNATIGIILSYLHQGMPNKVSLNWDLFSSHSKKIPVIISDPAGPLTQFISTRNNKIIWNNALTSYQLPTIHSMVQHKKSLTLYKLMINVLLFLGLLLLLVLIRRRYIKSKSISFYVLNTFVFLGILLYVNITNFIFIDKYIIQPNLSNTEARNILQHLLKNIYRSFNFKNESMVYDKLNISLSGDILETVYLKHNNAMRLQKLGGASAKVDQVTLLSVKKIQYKRNTNLQVFRCSWVVSGKIGHWGHIHQRKNKYDAIVYFGPRKQHWKIFDIESIQESRLQ